MTYEQRSAQASAYYKQSLERVRTTPEPDGQKFPIGTRVKIAKDIGSSMSHFPNDRMATVEYTYAHAYGGDDVKSYRLNVDDYGSVAWYEEWQLKEVRS